MILTALVLCPFLLGALAWSLPRRTSRRAVLVGASLLQVLLAWAAMWRGPAPEWGGALALDPLGKLFLGVTTLLFAAASLYTFGYMALHRHPRKRHYVPVLLFFLGSMTLATLSQHLGLFWVALEATTLSSAPLVYFDRSEKSLEAAWKYLILCSVGIALALAGTFFLALALPAEGPGSLLVADLVARAPLMSAPWLKVGFLFLLVGYGTKMGLAPMHTWLPDAHAEAPPPVSALLSGALLNCAFLGILRALEVMNAAGLSSFVQKPLLAFGFLSMATGTAFLIRQPDYKRLLAYSSVEHMGILAIGVGLGSAQGIFGALLHALNHSLAKGLLFFAAGLIFLVTGTKSVAEVRGLIGRSPLAAALFVAGFFAITGTPPFGLFVSEFTILSAAFSAGHPVLAVLYLALLVAAFTAMGAVVLPMVFGSPGGAREGSLSARNAWLLGAPAVLLGLTSLGLGLWIPRGLMALLKAGAILVSGGHP